MSISFSHLVLQKDARWSPHSKQHYNGIPLVRQEGAYVALGYPDQNYVGHIETQQTSCHKQLFSDFFYLHWMLISPLDAKKYRGPPECHSAEKWIYCIKIRIFRLFSLLRKQKSTLLFVWYKASCCNSGQNSGQEKLRKIGKVARMNVNIGQNL